MAEVTTTYTGKDIQVLEGLEPVRKRPGMYIGGTGKPGLHHLLWEIVDNAVDEAVNGFASLIEVTLHADGCSVTVSDNGRGIPVDLHPVKKIPTLELILTTLHAGGKFDRKNYITSGGLHGVGASVVNALSEELVATVRRDGKTYQQRFARGKPKTKLKVIAENTRGTGTSIYFRPDPEIFETTTFDAEWIREQLEVKTYLNRNLKIIFKDETSGERYEFQHQGGIVDYLHRLVLKQGSRVVHAVPFVLLQEELRAGARLEVALQWTEAPQELIKSFVNGIPTVEGGTHEQGFKDAVRGAVRAYMETHDLLPKNLEVTADDIREGLVAVINLFMVEPQFQGQTKEKLNNPEARTLVLGAVRLELEQFLNAHPTMAEAIVARIIQAAKARLASRAAARSVRRQTSVSHRLNLPGKLADCTSTNPEECELFIVEGDSAGGSAKQARDRRFQAVLPLRGKVLNAEQASLRRVEDNKELANIVQALGCGLGDQLDLNRLRYHKIILLMDADSDGHHITTLLLTFFYRYLRPLIENGHVYVAQPPLYRIDAGKETYWALDDADRDRILQELQKKRKNLQIEIQRFKGLGEMMPDTLRETTLDPQKRRLLRVTIPETARLLTEQTIAELMGRDVSMRFRFIMENAARVDAEALDV
ncbi:DNA gyrase/topoisomerase IV subunit B [Rhodothermus bifroesti]|uniref:DNA topoisomerase (ATP-hydrolyzing) n=1 Tax=Rhodothermus marinus TaxID=29549 RepID=A0A7V2F794_RHOMR|nr:DNA topoisomerase IV subunit B [Rhodothermus bifroesti]GBD00609.1 DNA gyrase subunit B [bacterium HR18]